MRSDDGGPKLAVLPPFLQVGFRVDDDSTRYCALLAESDVAQQEGMQGKSDLLGYDAMVFAFKEDTRVSFINHFVPIDLSIGWYDRRGRLVDDTTMQACPSGKDCPTYASKQPFRYAVETPAGRLAALGLTSPGATLHVGGGC
ncbi:MAG TPA: DUF192 domain-containing protein [Acidimicrobiales bacterium]|nr:DUF192 domain-containing protein [Acidimicrobiales bacterium]